MSLSAWQRGRAPSSSTSAPVFCPPVSGQEPVSAAAERTRSRWASRGIALALLASPAVHAQATQSDKLLHASASAAVVDVVWAGAALCDQPLWVRLAASVGAGAGVGLAKEGVDLLGFGTPDVADLVFDGFGIGIGVAVALVVEVVVDAPNAPVSAPQE